MPTGRLQTEQTDSAGDGDRSLLLISLGPVQEFIASARRCQDLWYGSWLLSDLARAVATAVGHAPAVKLIFPPGLGQVRERDNVANKILAEVPTLAIPALTLAADQAMRACLLAHGASAFNRLDTHCSDRAGTNREVFYRKLALEQLGSLMEMQWVAVTLTGSNYGDARHKAEAALAARKNTRNWATWTGIAGVPKSSLDGIRESVLDEVLFGGGLSRRREPALLPADQLRKRYFVKPAERLCGVGLLKRLGTDDAAGNPHRPAFHSTSHMAAAPLLARLAGNEPAKAAWNTWLEALKDAKVDVDRFKIGAGQAQFATIPKALDGSSDSEEVPRVWPSGESERYGYDGYLLFPSRVAELVEDYSATLEGKRKEVVQRLKGAQRDCLKALGASSLGPPAYYAVLLADGDRMGKAIDGLRGAEQHRALGLALTGFASHCLDIVENHGGSLVYSGGDDVLALLPLHTALRCADALQVDFAEKVQKLCLPDTGESERPTLSVGLAIAHHLSPMADALELARRAERLAKGNNRNSLAVICSKRSGGTLEFVASWKSSPAAELAKWAGRFQDGSLPNSAAFDLEDGLSKLQVGLNDCSNGEVEALHGVAQALAKRSAGRRRGNRGTSGLADGVEGELAGALTQATNWPAQAKQLAEKLQLARLFGEAAKAAWGDGTASEVTK